MVRAKKHLGQHFLKNPDTAARIAEHLSGEGYQKVLEIGPGMGVLTQHLLQSEKEVFVVEIDTESVLYLEEHYPKLDQHIIPGDFLQLDLRALMGEPFALTGNYPYNISSQIIFKMLEYPDLIPEMTGMFQKEVADRLTAEPGSKTYGILSVLSAVIYDREYLFTVEPEEFIPPPKVRSGVIRFKRKDNWQPEVPIRVLSKIVKAAFNQRRKTLRNALKPLNLPLESIEPEILQKRAEQLSWQEFVDLSKKLSA
jgi:16S rRNA (adenine1518-N6/adenine1519-N6)-dimethyltransferase